MKRILNDYEQLDLEYINEMPRAFATYTRAVQEAWAEELVRAIIRMDKQKTPEPKSKGFNHPS
jgi:hypothetical protein